VPFVNDRAQDPSAVFRLRAQQMKQRILPHITPGFSLSNDDSAPFATL
jgi:hypothetical protein